MNNNFPATIGGGEIYVHSILLNVYIMEFAE